MKLFINKARTAWIAFGLKRTLVELLEDTERTLEIITDIKEARETLGPRKVEDIREDVIAHHENHPEHGLNCECMDRFIWELKALLRNRTIDKEGNESTALRRWEYALRRAAGVS